MFKSKLPPRGTTDPAYGLKAHVDPTKSSNTLSVKDGKGNKVGELKRKGAKWTHSADKHTTEHPSQGEALKGLAKWRANQEKMKGKATDDAGAKKVLPLNLSSYSAVADEQAWIEFARADVEWGDQNNISLAATDPAQRQKLASTGAAMSDGSYPIPNVTYLKKAVKAVGRTSAGKRDAVKRHIKRRAKALKAEHVLPDSWNSDASTVSTSNGSDGGDVELTRHVRTPEGAQKYRKPIGSPLGGSGLSPAAHLQSLGSRVGGDRLRPLGGPGPLVGGDMFHHTPTGTVYKVTKGGGAIRQSDAGSGKVRVHSSEVAKWRVNAMRSLPLNTPLDAKPELGRYPTHNELRGTEGPPAVDVGNNGMHMHGGSISGKDSPEHKNMSMEPGHTHTRANLPPKDFRSKSEQSAFLRSIEQYKSKLGENVSLGDLYEHISGLPRAYANYRGRPPGHVGQEKQVRGVGDIAMQVGYSHVSRVLELTRHVRTPEGAKLYKKPIGSPLGGGSVGGKHTMSETRFSGMWAVKDPKGNVVGVHHNRAAAAQQLNQHNNENSDEKSAPLGKKDQSDKDYWADYSDNYWKSVGRSKPIKSKSKKLPPYEEAGTQIVDRYYGKYQ